MLFLYKSLMRIFINNSNPNFHSFLSQSSFICHDKVNARSGGSRSNFEFSRRSNFQHCATGTGGNITQENSTRKIVDYSTEGLWMNKYLKLFQQYKQEGLSNEEAETKAKEAMKH